AQFRPGGLRVVPPRAACGALAPRVARACATRRLRPPGRRGLGPGGAAPSAVCGLFPAPNSVLSHPPAVRDRELVGLVALTPAAAAARAGGEVLALTTRSLLLLRGRVGLYHILRELEVGSGDEVLIQAFTCVAVPEAVMAA